MTQWLTTAPNPRAHTTGYHVEQRGEKLHAVAVDRAACGLRPRHGWGLDTSVENKCEPCEKAMKRLSRLKVI